MVVRSDVGGATACPATDTVAAGPSSAPLHANSHGSSAAARRTPDRRANRDAGTHVPALVNCMCAYLPPVARGDVECPVWRPRHIGRQASERFREGQYNRGWATVR